ncbi:cytochrome P450 [Gymnopus androsaceus JB14]|uniref:Cytochrome P450 n=1 Tax=Gymnopus androsaceus JB14 TaxID=1447944 RepID=A0A6A4HSC8_9AGAR|nr:cytochrome P450 [Gymnopus androsaceus JB14]
MTYALFGLPIPESSSILRSSSWLPLQGRSRSTELSPSFDCFTVNTTSTSHDLPGPPSSSWWFGNFREAQATENAIFYKRWVGEYGPTMRFKFLLNTSRLYTTVDPKALSHILNGHIYGKPELTIWNMNRISGPGLFTVENERHKNPAFGPSELRDLTKTFVEKSDETKDIWISEIEAQGNVARIDAMTWLSRLTLDVIGITGFNHNFHALNMDSEVNELHEAFSTVFSYAFTVTSWMIVQGVIPALRLLPNARWPCISAFIKATDIWHARDLLSLLVHSNMSTDLPEDQRMSDEEVRYPPSLLLAMKQYRQQPVHKESMTMEELNSLPYLDSVVRECLRFHAPVPYTARAAVADDILPLSTPFTDKNGNICNELRPERWEKLPEACSRACIGYRFSDYRDKCHPLLACKVFEFDLPVRSEEIATRTSLVQRPYVSSEMESTQMAQWITMDMSMESNG